MNNKLIPGVRIIRVVNREYGLDQEYEDETLEIEYEYLGNILTYLPVDDGKSAVNYTGWVCRDVETGEIGIQDPNADQYFFKGDSPKSKK